MKIRQSKIVVWGYLAVLQRLRLRIPALAPMEGGVGNLILPSLTCDAPLVALGLAAAGQRVVAALSNPGSSRLAFAARQLLEISVETCYFGPDKGKPLALQVISTDGSITWFSDPTWGLASLTAFSTADIIGDWLYVDDYPWLEQAMALKSRPLSQQGIYANFGTITPGRLQHKIAIWRKRIGDLGLICQASIGRTAMTLQEVKELSMLGLRSGADLVLISAGARGLALAQDNSVAAVPSRRLHFDPVADSSGAGAALSVALLAARITGPINNIDEIAQVLADVGASQCSISGPLDHKTLLVWQRLIQSYWNSSPTA